MQYRIRLRTALLVLTCSSAAAVLLAIGIFSPTSGLRFMPLRAAAATLTTTGMLTDVRVPVSAAYTVAVGDKGSTVALGGNAFYTLTFGTPTNYDDAFATLVVNEDAGRGKTVALYGQSPFILWPGQTAIVYRDGSTWQVMRQTRWHQTITNAVVYVDPVQGNDSNDGLAPGAGAVRSIWQAVIGVVQRQWDIEDHGGQIVTIQLADGVYTGSAGQDILHLPGPFVGLGGNFSVVIQGNASNPSATVVRSDGSTDFSLFNGAQLILKNLRMETTGGGSAISVSSHSRVRLASGIVFGDIPGSGGSHMFLRSGGQIQVDAGYTIVGSAAYHVLTAFDGTFQVNGSFPITVASDLTFNTFAYAAQGSIQVWGGSSVATGGHTVTGRRFFVDTLSTTLDTGGVDPNVFFPGTVAGVLPSGASGSAGIGAGTGNVGIGTTTPHAQLELYGTTARERITHDAGSTVSAVDFYEGAAEQGIIQFISPAHAVGPPRAGMLEIINQTAHGIDLQTNGAVRMMLDQNGNVGIGTMSPAATLDVAGTAKVGSSGSPRGITLYDTATNQPYCVTVRNGTLSPSSGACQ